MSLKIPQTGQCQCGHIQYRITRDPLVLYVCHCQQCQKQSSSAFGMSLWVNRDGIEFLSGELTFWQTQGDSGKVKYCAFCGYCGTRLYHASDDEKAPISLKAGTLNDTTWLRPICHIWTKRAQPWLSIDPTRSVCYAEEPDNEDDLIRQWQSAVANQ